jgi:small subunit ribosomal protein S8
MSIDTIGNFLTIIRNKVMASSPYAVASYSKVNVEIARILKEEGFIKDVQIVEGTETWNKTLKIVLKYVNGESVLHEITRVSKPSRRMYAKVKNLKPVINGLGVVILSTNRGIMTDKQAKESSLRVGGEVICTVW